MMEHGYSRNKYDNCVYHRKLNDGSFVYLLLYTDDMLITTKDMSKVDKLKAQLKQEFEMKDLIAAKKILKIKIHRKGKKENCSYLRRNTSRRCWRDLACLLPNL